MCGIAGILLATPRSKALGSIERMTEALRHRGPDAGARIIDESVGIALGHRRLAIIELSERGAQPMRSADGRYVIVFNGEIFNHLHLRRELELRGAVEWQGTSDTETLIECFAGWGVAATLQKCVGMFALALWDRRERRLTLARDRFGEKPLFYGYVGHGDATALVFGSELKALRAFEGFQNPIDRDSLALFLRYSYVPTPWSIYRDVFKLEPGSIIELTADQVARRRRKIERYWTYENVVAAGLANPLPDEASALDALERALSEAVGLQLIADVPVGAFLSGGIDSSIIAALMQSQSRRRVKTFTVGFDEADFNEAPHAREVAHHLGTEHCEIRVTPKEARAVIPNLPIMYDEPFGDSSQIPTSIICAAAQREVRVVLSGDAGDEMFGGYNRYTIGPKLWDRLSTVPSALRCVLGRGLAAMPDAGWSMVAQLPGLGRAVAPFSDKAYKLSATLSTMNSVEDLYRGLVSEWSSENVPVLRAKNRKTLLDDFAFASIILEPTHRMMLLDGVTYLPDDILAKVDRAAMAVGLETRVPLLDHRVAEVACRLPLSMKVRNHQGKWALRQILYRHVPRELVERPKSGFAIPVGQWLRGPLCDWADNLLAERRLNEQGYFDVAVIRNLWSEHLSGRRDWTARLWNILMFQSWLDAWDYEKIDASIGYACHHSGWQQKSAMQQIP
jgi:asparagine synthase (glutamine-hydrolysing)